jgi:TRAP-type C4-dicarboxylate transport system permease large subunit
MILMIVAGATVLGHFLAITQIPFKIAGWVGGLDFPSWCVISIIILIYMIGGCFIDALALIMLTVPIFYPVVTQLGYNPVWFGVVIVLVTQIGVITPPVGVNVYVVRSVARDVRLETIFKGVIPLLFAIIAATALLIIFPSLALFLPEFMSK